MAKSWEEQNSPSASFPACLSLWLVKKEAHANTQLSQSSIVSNPVFIHFTIVCPTLHYGSAQLLCLIDYLKSTVLAHMDRYRANENFRIVRLQFYKDSVQFHLLGVSNESTYLPLTTLRLRSLYLQSNKGCIQEDNTDRLAVLAHFSRSQGSGRLVQMIVCYCLPFW